MVNFFRIKENGSVKTPTFTAVGVSFVLWLLTVIVLRHYMLTATCVMIVEYIISAILFSKPIRVPIQKLLYSTRFPHIVGGTPAPSTVRWIAANSEMLRRTNLTIFYGKNSTNQVDLYNIHKGGFDNTVVIQTDDRAAKWQ